MDEGVKIIVPSDQKWLMRRTIELYRLWKTQEVNLQPEQDSTAKTEYER